MPSVIYHPAYRMYAFGEDHPFSPIRVEMTAPVPFAIEYDAALIVLTVEALPTCPFTMTSVLSSVFAHTVALNFSTHAASVTATVAPDEIARALHDRS